MLAYITEKIECNLKWRMAFMTFIRASISILAVVFFLSIWQAMLPITGAYNDYIFIQGTTSRENIIVLEKNLKKIPQWLVKQHKENGGKINLRNEPFPDSDYTEFENNYRVIGTFQKSNNLITLLNEKEVIENTLFHEYGHYLDSLFLCTESIEFQEIYEQEKDNYFNFVDSSSYHISCESEYFAGAFTMYFNQKNKLKKYCPLTYNFIKEQLERNEEK